MRYLALAASAIPTVLLVGSEVDSQSWPVRIALGVVVWLGMATVIRLVHHLVWRLRTLVRRSAAEEALRIGLGLIYAVGPASAAAALLLHALEPSQSPLDLAAHALFAGVSAVATTALITGTALVLMIVTANVLTSLEDAFFRRSRRRIRSDRNAWDPEDTTDVGKRYRPSRW